MKTLASYLTLTFIVLSNLSHANDLDVQKIEAARRYLEAANFEVLWKSLLTEHAASLPEKDREEYLAGSEDKKLIEKFDGVLMEGLVAIFTVDELNAMADFYGSKAGQSSLAKLGKFSAYVNPLMEDIVVEHMTGKN